MMTKHLRQSMARGFTLIELLIVVIIIAILAAIAIPQFANTSGDAQESALDANLNTVRSAIELFRIQHNNVLPTVATSAGGTCTGGTAGVGTPGTDVAFREQLTTYSNAAGQTCTQASTGFIYGPYLRAIPNESITGTATAGAVAVVTTATPGNPTGTSGWRYNNVTGRFEMNSVAADRRGQPYNTH